MEKVNDANMVCLEGLMGKKDPRVERYYLKVLKEEGADGYDRAFLKTAMYFKNLLPKRMHEPLALECRKAGIAV